MANHSSISNNNNERPPSAFQWPIPSSSSDISIKEILDNYQHDPEILKLLLVAKAEEDKKQTAQSTLQIERTRIQQRMMDLDAIRSYPQPPPGAVIFPPSSSSQQPHHQQQSSSQQSSSSSSSSSQPQQPHNHHQQQHQQQHNHQHQPTSYHSLPPFQQQVIARVTSDHQHHQPDSPAGYYPHSAHPLCPPTSSHHDQQQQSKSQQKTPQPSTATTTTNSSQSSYYYDHERKNGVGKKRPHDAKLSHHQVMEVLKAKLQRGNNAVEKNKRARTLPNPLVTTGTNATTTTTTTSNTSNNNNNHNNSITTKPALPPPPTQHPHHHSSQPPLSTPSPRSAKPILPPIDTSVGRIPSRGPLSSNASHKLPPFSATAALADASVIKGERRVKSLSPPPFATSTHRNS
ncbi:hypothetical protein BDA99DRAFT_534590 [Phascolomyces articulosus]|uniref:Uncharacterized protein n=1 Tax=Phascolomyces articulosus TaxID=60185 RepID=A0AAD5PG82_9FUNG|nr:hypothetical protein BDA99DRAFT_534590 [Phascolomyces articulosus]